MQISTFVPCELSIIPKAKVYDMNFPFSFFLFLGGVGWNRVGEIESISTTTISSSRKVMDANATIIQGLGLLNCTV